MRVHAVTLYEIRFVELSHALRVRGNNFVMATLLFVSFMRHSGDLPLVRDENNKKKLRVEIQVRTLLPQAPKKDKSVVR